jgi:hypothetical protein
MLIEPRRVKFGKPSIIVVPEPGGQEAKTFVLEEFLCFAKFASLFQRVKILLVLKVTRATEASELTNDSSNVCIHELAQLVYKGFS